jgi:hypothetical protein
MIVQAGEISSPPKTELFYLSQRPYLVVGSLRDQLLYPKPPARVWAGSAAEDRKRFVQVAGEEPQYTNRDAGERVKRCFVAVWLRLADLGRPGQRKGAVATTCKWQGRSRRDAGEGVDG